jgi:hypothetical protein
METTMKSARCALIALLAVAPISLLSAQSRPQTREGFTIAFGVGNGSVEVGCSFCNTDRPNDGSGFLRIGRAVRPNLIIGGEYRGWFHNVDLGTAAVSLTLADVMFYPLRDVGWYVEVGLGLGQYETSDDASNASLTAKGAAFAIGTGYDIRVGKRFSITPFVSSSRIPGGTVKQNGITAAEKMEVSLRQIGIAFTWH